MSTILGINAYHGDSSACLTRDGQIVAAVEEERFRRVKHWAGFPSMAIAHCLEEAGIGPQDVEHVAYSSDPRASLMRKIRFALSGHLTPGLIRTQLANMRKASSSQNGSSDPIGIDELNGAQIHRIEHHRSHSASAFYVSPFEEAAVVSIDALGDFRSTMVSSGEGNRLKLLSTVEFPHSLGILYTAVTQYLGFPRYGDEYKVMGLAAFGVPAYLEEFRKMVSLGPEGTFKLNQKYFLHVSKGVSMTWEGGEPEIGRLYSDHMVQRLGPAREFGDELDQRHNDIAASLQAVLEETYFHILNYAHEATGKRALTLAGGVAFNSVANGKIFDNTPFDDVYIQSAAGDAGTALGAAYYVHHNSLGNSRDYVMETSYWGPHYDSSAVAEVLIRNGLPYEELDEDELLRRCAEAIAAGKVVGWFQGRAEWGPRALGNRSILVDPRRGEMKDVLNERIKRREQFRPFAPSILVEAVVDYFEQSYPDPFMVKVYPIKPDKQPVIPAVTHVDGTGRLQTVSEQENPRYWRLIKEFERQTGVPVLLNTSFNENEPIVCSPDEAVDCYLRTRMDALVVGNFYVENDENA